MAIQTLNDLEDPQTIPVLLLDGTLQYPSISADTTTQDLVETLIRLDEVKCTVFDVAPSAWALQRVHKENPGRSWDETELAALDDDILEPTSLIAPLVNKSGSDSADTSPKQFSAFPLTSHAPAPVVRLVARHPLHSLSLSFLRIPEIDDGFAWTVFFGKGATVQDVINNVVQELGLLKVLPSSRGGGQIEYALEVLSGNQATQLSRSTLMVDTLRSSEHPPAIQFCIPDQWFRRKPRPSSIQSHSTTDSSADEEREREGTAKQSRSGARSSTPFHTASRPGSPEWRGSVAQSRLTSLLAGWSQPAPATTSAIVAIPTGNRKSVSEPLLVQQNTDGKLSMGESVSSGGVDLEEFERCIDLLGVKGEARANMHSMPPEKKRQLVEQLRGKFDKVTSANSVASPTSATYGPSSGSALLPRLVPQFSGDSSFFKRISAFPTWGSTAFPPPPSVNPMGRSSGEYTTDLRFSDSPEKVEEDTQSVQPQATGSMFSTWWAALGGEASTDNEHSTSARAYVDGIRKSRNPDSKLVKHLISLRVHLSTAKLPWIETFIAEEGIIAISGLLSSLVGKGGKRKALTDSGNSVLLEVIRSLRALSNTEPGFDAVLLSPTIVTHVAYSLHGTSLKTRTLAAELLAAICMVSFDEGHRAVLASLSEYRIAYNELFRFQSLVSALKIPDSIESAVPEVTFPMEEEGVWEARTAFMALINALTNCPHTLEERIVLRDEFSRRGLNEVVAALRYIKPPDLLLKQLDMYTEEKYEDEEDFRERARRAVRDSRMRSLEVSEPSTLFDEIMQAARLLEAEGAVESILRKLNLVFQGVSDTSFKNGTLSVMDEFVGGVAAMEDSEQAWTTFLQSLVASVQRLSGRKLPIGNTKTLEEEVQEFHTRLEDLTRENAALKTSSGIRHRQEGSAVYVGGDPPPMSTPALTLSPKLKTNAGPKSGNEMINGLLQRLAQKEKKVTELLGEIDRLKIQNSGEAYDPDDRVRKERDKAKLNALSEEVTTLKERIGEMDNALSNKDKEIENVKHALQSVYSRFHLKEDEKTNDMDVQLIVSRTFDRLSEREQEVVALRAEVQVLKQSLAVRSQEQEFKANNPPPPPPPGDRRKITISKGNKIEPPGTMETVGSSEETSTPAPPPAPPPPPPFPDPALHRVPLNSSQDVSSDSLSSPTPPPPPPAPPAPPMFGSDAPPPPPPPPAPIAGGDLPPPPPPPPPPGGNVPPPPPLPGSAMHNRSRLKQSGPRLKPFFWNKLDNNSIVSTVWSGPSLVSEFNMDDLEATFTIDATPQTPSRMANTGKQNVTTLLETTRANNMAIMLSHFKIGYSAIRQALLDLDDSTLSIDDLKEIGKQLPTTDEMTRIKDFGDVTKLAKADQFIHEIMSIPRLSQRMECMIFRRRFELDVEEIRPDLKTIRDACRELQTSQLFKRTLEAILAVGNRLNGSSFRGSARGFRLEALLKMKETKTAKATPDCPTLLHYIARVLLRTEPKLTLFIEELPNLEPAARISFQTVSQAVQSAIASRAKVEAEIQLMKQLRHPSANDQFVTVMHHFIVQVSGSVGALKEMTASVENDLRSLFSYFGESFDSPDSLKPEDFFGMICSFSLSLQKAANDVAPRTPARPLRSAADKPEAIESTERTTKDLLAPPSRHERQRSFGRGDLDEALRTLKDGQTRRQRSTPSSIRVPVHKVFVDGRQDG